MAPLNQLFLVVMLLKGSFGQEELCYSDNKNPYILFSTKTSYRTIVKDEPELQKPQGCEPLQLWALIRHGARYTVRIADYMGLYRLRDEIIYNHNYKRSVRLCEQDIINLENWQFRMGLDQENAMHEEGLDETKLLADRLKRKFPELLKGPFVPGQFVVKVTNTTSDKTLQSGQTFLQELFPDNPLAKVFPPEKNDLMVKIYTPCINGILKKFTKASMQDYKHSDAYSLVLHEVKNRLGFTDLTAKQLHLMYNMCRYNKSWNYTKISPWCAIFTEDNLKVLEYFEDYKYSIKSGYLGGEINRNLGCSVLRDMVWRFKDIVENYGANEQPSAIFYMGHSTTINTLMVALGLANDEKKLTAFNYHWQANRKWRTTFHGPFNANIVAVLFRCDDGIYKVVIYQNEKPVKIDGCEDFYCSWETFYNKYRDQIESKSCNIDNVCKESHVWFYLLLAVILTSCVFVLNYILQVMHKKKISFGIIEHFSTNKEKKYLV